MKRGSVEYEKSLSRPLVATFDERSAGAANCKLRYWPIIHHTIETETVGVLEQTIASTSPSMSRD
jgi:hypothetical protein